MILSVSEKKTRIKRYETLRYAIRIVTFTSRRNV